MPHSIPHFGRLRWAFAISEDAIPGTIVGQVQGNEMPHSKRDYCKKFLKIGSRNARYAIVSEHKADWPFSVDSNTGNIFLKSRLDREKVPQYHFIVETASSSTPTLGYDRPFHTFSIVTVTVVDVNDNPPTFLTTYET